MALLPGLCTGCQRVQLLSSAKAALGELGCTFCQADVRVVPGCSYAERDRVAFAEMSDLVVEAAVAPAEARFLAAQLAGPLSPSACRRAFDVLCERMPGLVPWQQAVGQNAAAQRRALALLKTIFEALATARHASGTYARVDVKVRDDKAV